MPATVSKPLITSDQIRHLRAKLDLSQEEFAREVGVTKRTVGNWERGDPPRGAAARHLRHLYDQHFSTQP